MPLSYDEPGIRATYSVGIQHNPRYTAICNTPEISRTIIGGTKFIETRFDLIPSMQTYLIAFIVADPSHFTSIRDDSHKIPYRAFAKSVSIWNGDADMALEASVRILPEYEKYLKVNYSLTKMDQAALPSFAPGAMENWGLVTYREESLLWNEMNHTTWRKFDVLSIISHEFAVSHENGYRDL